MQKLKNNINLGNNLRLIRNKHEYTQDQIIAQLDSFDIVITRSTYSRYETGEMNIPVAVLIALHQIYKCSYDSFFDGLYLVRRK